VADLLLTAAPGMVGYRMVIEDPVPPLTVNLLAASGLFDRIEIKRSQSGSDDVILEGRSLLKAALVIWTPLNAVMSLGNKGKDVFCLEHRKVMADGTCPKCG
jgi:hypothetical protein